MLAFLKRRWILLSCAVVVMACSVINIRKSSKPMGHTFGIVKGELWYMKSPPLEEEHTFDVRYLELAILSPKFGTSPIFKRWKDSPTFTYGYTVVVLPLWLPLSAVLGWIAWSELRWREKRAKAIDAKR